MIRGIHAKNITPHVHCFTLSKIQLVGKLLMSDFRYK